MVPSPINPIRISPPSGSRLDIGLVALEAPASRTRLNTRDSSGAISVLRKVAVQDEVREPKGRPSRANLGSLGEMRICAEGMTRMRSANSHNALSAAIVRANAFLALILPNELVAGQPARLSFIRLRSSFGNPAMLARGLTPAEGGGGHAFWNPTGADRRGRLRLRPRAPDDRRGIVITSHRPDTGRSTCSCRDRGRPRRRGSSGGEGR